MTTSLNGPPPLRFDVVSLFPDFFTSPLASGLIAKAL
ncbi:MAG: tRNA (guanosine(37)-N1)-methyltransferase TrmD, partial [Nodosilinea sp.]